MRYLYNLIFYLLLPFIFLRLLLRSRKSPLYRQRWAERLGFIKATNLVNPIWVHAVSFGEAKVATPLIEALQQRYPDKQFIVTTMTVTGSQQIQNALGKKVTHCYVPYDYPQAVKRFLKKIKPQALIIMETELWPNILYYCEKNNIPIVIANARLSESSAKGYQHARLLIKPMLQKLTQVLAQTDLDAERYAQIGAPAKNIHITGNIKFDITPPANLIQQGKLLRESLGLDRPIWIAASTHPHEEEIILNSFKQIRKVLPNVLLILVPRHPERFNEVAKLCQQENFKIVRRSQINATNNNFSPAIDIYLGDTMGELWLLYAAADVAFVGGSLIKQGGHNVLEPAALAVPIITGPYIFNFQQIVTYLQAQQAINIVENSEQLALTVTKLLQDNDLRRQQGEHAQQVVKQNRGALENHFQWLKVILAASDHVNSDSLVL